MVECTTVEDGQEVKGSIQNSHYRIFRLGGMESVLLSASTTVGELYRWAGYRGDQSILVRISLEV